MPDDFVFSEADLRYHRVIIEQPCGVDQTIINGIEKPVIASANGLRAIYGNKQVIVKSEEDGPVMVSIYNASGMLVEQTSAIIKGGRARIDVSHLDTGLYVARAINESGTSVSCKFRK